MTSYAEMTTAENPRHGTVVFALILSLILFSSTDARASNPQKPRVEPKAHHSPAINEDGRVRRDMIPGQDPGPLPPWTGSRISPVHQIPLKDELGQTIVPTESNPLPYSAKYSCAPCHDYDIVSGGSHFGAETAREAGRPGEPWVWVDERTGTLLPLSYHAWKGVWNPRQLGLSPWDMTLLFGRHMTGGGPAEPEAQDVTPESRWNVSGPVEVNCLACHNASPRQNLGEWAKQVMRQNFRWAATAAAGLGEVGGMASRLGPTWDIFDGPNPDDSEWAVAPFVKYDKALFDSKNRAFLDISYKPADSRCLACHATTPAGRQKFDFDADVHTAAGIACVSCHRNDVTHNMVRGYEAEIADNPALPSEEFTCRACHLGAETSRGEKILPGRLGAPTPRHRGIPQVHIERLACTVCHSGPRPEKELATVRTSRANRLGIFGIADWATTQPAIQEPVYLRGANGKLTPQRLLWPAFWAEMRGKDVTPLKPEQVQAAAGDILFPEKAVTRVLAAFANIPDLDGVPVLLMGGQEYLMNVDGGLNAKHVKMGDASVSWAVEKDGKITPIVADFDPANAEQVADPEAKIQKALEALAGAEQAPGSPAILYKNYLYRVVEGTLDKSERKEPAAPSPTFFWLKDGRLIPMVADFERRTIAAVTGTDQTLTEEQVGLVLKALGEKDHVYIASGKIFRLGAKGTLEAKADDNAAPVAWPFAHEVRPARQALGAGGCTDCHSAGSDFFFAKVRAAGPLVTEKAAVRSAASFMGVTGVYHRIFGLSFTVRPVLKVVLWICIVLVGSLLLIVFLTWLGRFAGLTGPRR
jgi:hypothetical protein